MARAEGRQDATFANEGHGQNALLVARALRASPYVEEVIHPDWRGINGTRGVADVLIACEKVYWTFWKTQGGKGSRLEV